MRASAEDLEKYADATGMRLQFQLMNFRALGRLKADEFFELVDAALNSTSRSMAAYPKELSKLGEDQLSIYLLAKLEGLGFAAGHDTTVGGHCDIVIREGEELLWLGEAKLVTGQQNAHIEDGYLQLLSRYSTALPGQDRGALIIFCNCERIDLVLNGWADHISAKRGTGFSGALDEEAIEYRSSEAHFKNGKKFHVLHKPISIYWAPEERDKLPRK